MTMRAEHEKQLAAVEPLLKEIAGARAEEVGKALRQLAELTLATNEKFNLTADATPELFWVRQIEDSLRAGWEMQRALPRVLSDRSDGADRFVGFSILDVGSGSGMPALVLALLWPGVRFTLLEARQKRVGWLQEAVGALGLKQVKVICGRAETQAHAIELRARFDLVTARALARLPVLAEYTLPFARQGGSVAAIKPAEYTAELRDAKNALGLLGSEVEAVRPWGYTRSDGKESVVLLLPKQRTTPRGYPRHEGVPAKTPL